MAKGWFRRTTKKFFIVINALLVLLFLLAALSPCINPDDFWLHGLLALTTPYLILLLILFVLFWLIIKPIWSLMPIIALLIGWQQIAVVFAWTGNSIFTKRKSENHFRIVNWNIQSFNGLSKNALAKKMVRNEVAASILKTYPDIICLQEFNNAAAENNISLFSRTHPYHFFSKDYQRNDGTYQAGCIIFSKYPMIDSGRVVFPSEESFIYADILKGNDTMRIFTTHLQSFKFKKKDYADIEKIKETDESSFGASLSLMRKMKAAYQKRGVQTDLVSTALERSPYPSIITGDFNDVPNSYTYFNIKGSKKDAFLQRSFGLGRTFFSIAPTLRIDYILLDNQFEVKQFDMVDESLSDHIMLVADIRLKK
jgi:endonuclease/exonuclease/phosphatase family metal-dependent hydrolase